jgi:hypothetical protein
MWSGTIAAAEFVPANAGWESEKAYGAYECAKFGTSSVTGAVTTPAFALTGTTTMAFKAGAWKTTSEMTKLTLSAEGGTVSPQSVEMVRGAFTDYTVTVTGTGSVKVTFEVQADGNKKGRFFLDEVVVVNPNATAIQTVTTPKTTTRIYTLDGRYVGADPNLLPRGLYIIGGKKIVK